MCNHDDSKESTYLECLDYMGYEVYMCECGALINIHDERNYSGEIWHPMTPKEFIALVAEIKLATFDSVKAAVLKGLENAT